MVNSLNANRLQKLFYKSVERKIQKYGRYWQVYKAFHSFVYYRKASRRYKKDLMLRRVFLHEQSWYDRHTDRLVCDSDEVQFFGVTTK